MGTTIFVWHPVFDCVTHELDENNNVKAEYHNEPQQFGGVLSQRRGTTTHYHHHDGLGSTRFLTDSSGNVTDTYFHDAWGNLVASTGTTINPFKWVGKYGYYTDNSTAQVYVRARMYQPTVARWCSVNLMETRYSGRTETAYCHNRPLEPVSLNGLNLTNAKATSQTVTQVPFKMSLSMVSSQLSAGCGHFASVIWQIGFPNGVPCNGWVIQEVHVAVSIDHQCNPCERSLFESCRLSYLEAWRVKKGPPPVFEFVQGFDRFGTIVHPNRKGRIRMRGYFFYVCEGCLSGNQLNDPDGRLTCVDIGWTPQRHGWKSGVQGDAPCNYSSGDLLAKPFDPEKAIPQPHRPGPPRDPDHHLNVEYNCCLDSNPTIAFDYAPV